MHFTYVGIENFKVYAGRHEIAFVEPDVSAQRNVVLFGGLNGAGKTSLLQALVVGLYGSEAEGIAFPRSKAENLQKAYSKFLEETLSYRARNSSEFTMRVKVCLEDNNDKIIVERTWWFDDNGGSYKEEVLDIFKNGKPLEVNATSVEQRREVCQEFIDALIPARVAKFFFFDGEEIKSISERDPSEAVIDGLDALLGFSTLRRLEEDLEKIIRDIKNEVEESPKKSAFLHAQAQVSELEDSKRSLDQEIADEQRRLAGIKLDLAKVSERLNQLFSGTVVQESSDLLDRITEAEGESRQLAAEIGRFASESLYLALPARLLDNTASQLSGERSGRQWAERRSQLDPQRDKVLERLLGDLSPQANPPLTTAQRAFLRERFVEEWVDMFNPPPDNVPDVELFGDWSIDAFDLTLQQIEEVRSNTRNELLTRITRRTELDREIDRLRAAYKQFEAGPEAQEAIDYKATLAEQRASCETGIEDKRRASVSLDSEIANLRANVTKLGENLALSEEVRRRLEKAIAAKNTVVEFMDALRQRRLKALGEKITEMMRRLTRKEDLVERVIIDPDTYTLRIVNRNGVEVISPSAGEREIFALAMIWGLGQISGRRLPMIIDTPLGRLDKSHRANIVTEFFPRAGQQVVILSTDAEIDERWYAKIEPQLLQEFALEFDEEEDRTRVIAGRYLHLDAS